MESSSQQSYCHWVALFKTTAKKAARKNYQLHRFLCLFFFGCSTEVFNSTVVRSLSHHRRDRDVTAARATNKLQIWLLWQSCVTFLPRVVSYPIPWTCFSEAEKFENNEIHRNQQHRLRLFHGKALYAEVFRRNGDFQTCMDKSNCGLETVHRDTGIKSFLLL